MKDLSTVTKEKRRGVGYKMEFKWKEDHFVGEFSFGALHVSGQPTLGYSPFELMVSSISVCSGSVLKKILEKRRISVQDITVQANPVFKEEENRIVSIHLHFIIEANVSETIVQKCVALAFKNCPMVRSVEQAIQITESFEVK